MALIVCCQWLKDAAGMPPPVADVCVYVALPSSYVCWVRAEVCAVAFRGCCDFGRCKDVTSMKFVSKAQPADASARQRAWPR